MTLGKQSSVASYTNKVFAAWDYCIKNQKAAKVKSVGIEFEITVSLLFYLFQRHFIQNKIYFSVYNKNLQNSPCAQQSSEITAQADYLIKIFRNSKRNITCRWTNILLSLITCKCTAEALPLWGHHGYDRMVVGFITTYAISDYHH